LNEIGRLNGEDRKELNAFLDATFKLLDKNKIAQAEKKLIEISKTPNYFTREYLGRNLTKYEDHDKMMKITQHMLEHKLYGVRATALFYLYNFYYEEPEKIYEILEKTFDSVPWEVESIINDMWKRFPDLMKERMSGWIKSENSHKRSLSFHGMENIANSDPSFIMDFIGKVIDDETMEVQKKITHILTQVARVNPIIVFPYIREWLSEANEQRIKTIWVSMKKLANIVVQKNRRDKTEEFVVLTEQTIKDWMNDEKENISQMGERLWRIIQRNRQY
jgi:3-methyladenine DNA glycosylase AlkC